MKVLLALGVITLIATAFVFGNRPSPGIVTKVLDGDTLVIGTTTVRIHGIDAPEAGQSYGREATAALKPLEGYAVRFRAIDVDRYGRTVAKVYYGEEDIGLLMIRAGHAWHYARYDQSRAYRDAEAEAQSARRGLWAEDSPVAPWDWRQR